MEECFTPDLKVYRSLECPPVATASAEGQSAPGPKESTLAALRSFARAYCPVKLASMPDAPGIVLN